MEEVIERFKGCILSLKTKPGDDGISENIIGTLRTLDVDEGTLTLDEAMCNGDLLPDGFVLRSTQIADLTVCGKAVGNEVLTLVEADFMTPVMPLPPTPTPPPEPPKPLLPMPQPQPARAQVKTNITEYKPTPAFKVFETQQQPQNNLQQQPQNRLPSSQFQSLANPFINLLDDPAPAIDVKPFPLIPPQTRSAPAQAQPSAPAQWKTPLSEKQINIKLEPEPDPRSALEASLGITPTKKAPPPLNNVKNTNAHAQAPAPAQKTTATPKSKDTKVVYVASELERNYFETAKALKHAAHNSGTSPPKHQQYQQRGQPAHAPAPAQAQQQMNFSNLALANNMTPTCVLQKLVNSPNPKNGAIQQQQQQKPKKAAAAPADQINPFTKLLKRPVEAGNQPLNKLPELSSTSSAGGDWNLDDTKQQKAWPPKQRTDDLLASLINQGQGQGRSGPNRNGRTNGKSDATSTFEMTNDEIFAEEFDFDQNNAMFEKLPVESKKPTRPAKEPTTFCQTDTTFLAERAVESIKLTKGVKSLKNFVSDTGVVIPAVDMNVRSQILNTAHDCGLIHNRMVEVMGRAVAQICAPLLGNSFRLSPEREEDRPSVLICTGPHWQGAAGICAARILASQGVKTYVFAKRQEVNLCDVEERLYKMTGQSLVRESCALLGLSFDLVILAKDSHAERDLTLGPVYYKWVQNKPVVLIDPPVLNSYRNCFNTEGNSECRTAPPSRICILTPTLPLNYGSDSSVKIFLVNMGIPQQIFAHNGVIYKSPFGDKLTIQIFSEKQVQSQTKPKPSSSSSN